MSAPPASGDWLPEPDGSTRQSVAGYGPNGKADATSEAADFLSGVAPYPVAIGPEAYYGITGELVRLIAPHTEADPSFLLVSFLVYAGSVFGRHCHVWAGGDQHYSNLFAIGVGPTSTGRKGSAHGALALFFHGIDEDWIKAVQSGLSSGEGLIWAVRDPIFKREKVRNKDGPIKYRDVEVDAGIKDKRVLVRQSEFFGVLQAMRRQGNTLSPVIRDAWDRGDLNSMVKNSPAKATGAHVSIIGNITKEELLRGMLRDDADNGFANRFLWCCSVRSKSLPEGGKLYEVDFSRLHKRFAQAWHKRQRFGQLERDAEAADLWGRDDKPGIGLYSELTKERHGLLGAVTARAAAQVLRMSLVYALLDGAQQIRQEHLLAASEVWRYCLDSARYIFGDTIGDPAADQILLHLRRAPDGLTRAQIRDIFDRNKSSDEVTRALMCLHNAGLARFEKERTNGRPTERWFAVKSGTYRV